jgi:acyl-CoA synthetase (NDP forming)
MINFFFQPASIAIFGASTNPNKSGYKLVQNILDHNYSGSIFPINPKGGEILGKKIYKNLSEISEEVELAIIFVPNSKVISILKECIVKGIKGAIIESAGFGEVPEGLKLVDEIKVITENFTKIRVFGPNCTGLTFIQKDGEGFFASFVPMPKIKTGSIAIISQSGFINGGYFLNITSRHPNLGFRYVCAIGNKMDLNENDLLEYIMQDPEIGVICIYVESFFDVRKFIRLCNLAKNEYNKKIILLRSGLSKLGSQATASHTGALARERTELIKAVIKQCHCIEAEDFKNLFQIAYALDFTKNSDIHQVDNPGVSIITISGGAGAVMADLCDKFNVKIPLLSKNSFDELSLIYPKWMPPQKYSLLDIWPAVENAAGDYQKVMLKSLEIVLSDPNIHAVFLTAFYSRTSWKMNWYLVEELIKEHRKPVYVWLFGEYSDVLEAEKIFQELKIPVFYSEKEMISTFSKTISQ